MNWIRKATLAIRRVLTGATVTRAATTNINTPVDATERAATAPMQQESTILIGGGAGIESGAFPLASVVQSTDLAFDTEMSLPTTAAPVFVELPPIDWPADAQQAPLPLALVDEKPRVTFGTGPGEFTHGVYTYFLQTRRYKLFTPPGHAGRQLPLVVMLHGCNQDPDDFARGTGMNDRAREQGFFVLYPEQSPFANASRCWNWFMREHQQRGGGEPALLASMTQLMIEDHDIDPSRVYIAGLSAGGAMAAIVATAYPELFSAAGVHSGLAPGAASNVFEALSAMKSGSTAPYGSEGSEIANAVAANVGAMPTIVFHGDLDHTVHSRNGEQVIEVALGRSAMADAVDAAGNIGDRQISALLADNPQMEHGESARGQRYTRFTHHDVQGHIAAEYWQLHGAGHAWSGGNAEGSYTDPSGPDATREMLRFFFAHPAPAESLAMQNAAE